MSMHQEMAAKTRNLWALVYPAQDVPGQWVAHCLDHDIVTVGTSAHHAFEMIVEAVVTCAEDDIKHHRDPFARPKAPAEDWAELARITSEGTFFQGTLPSEDKLEGCRIASQLMLWVDVPEHKPPRAEPQPARWGMPSSQPVQHAAM